MSSKREKVILDKFFLRRSLLIKKYSNGYLDKTEFLKENYDYFLYENSRPFIKIDSYEKGMFNYQYYNILAKYNKMLAKNVKNTKKHMKYYNYYMNIANKYYDNKDESILEILKLRDFTNVSSYFIECDSEFLQNNLYEIVLQDKEEAIFHSKSERILNILKENKIFDLEIKKSLIEEYINERY